MPEHTMTEELAVLWSLAGLDDRLAVLETALRRHPQQRAELETRLNAERARIEDHKRKVGDLQLRRRQIEKDIETLAAEERKFQSQLPMVKKNEEYTALLHEIAGAKGRRSDRETDLLLLMEEEESVNGERPVLEQALKLTESDGAERARKIASEESSERDQVSRIEAERATLLARLPQALRSRYERIRASREGRAVVPILKGACGGCYRGQPPQALQEARRGDRFLVCDGCGRMLIWPPEGSAQA
jgi:predicted  nucleic acid-binding Zn-ribbon protein